MYDENGCHDSIAFENLVKHEKNCFYAKIKCPNE